MQEIVGTITAVPFGLRSLNLFKTLQKSPDKGAHYLAHELLIWLLWATHRFQDVAELVHMHELARAGWVCPFPCVSRAGPAYGLSAGLLRVWAGL